MTRTRIAALALSVVAVATIVLAALALGTTTISVRSVLDYLFTGSTRHESVTLLLREYRLPRVATAACAGAALGVAGLLMQTLFRNPLAEPSILGVSAGASLGVGIAVLASGTAIAGIATGPRPLVLAAAAGAAFVLAIILALSRWLTSVSSLLVVGVMVGALASSAVSLLMSASSPERLREFVVWGLGSFSGVDRSAVGVLALCTLIPAAASILLARNMDALSIGDDYARSMGVRVGALRVAIVILTAVMAGAVTGFCGPIAFIGLAAPHLARLLIGVSTHRVLLPVSGIVGAFVAVACSVLAQLPGDDRALPVGVVTPLFGVPVVVGLMIRRST